MKVLQRIVSLSVLTSFGLFGFAAVLMTDQVSAKELAKVNGQSITEKDLEHSLASLNEGQRQAFLKDVGNRSEVLQTVIDQEVLAQEAERLKIDQSAEFKTAMAKYRKGLLTAMVLEKKIAPQVTSKATQSYFNVHRNEFSTDQVHVQHILVSTEGEALNLIKRLKGPNADFQEIAEKESRDPSAKNNRGDLGFITRDRMVREFTNTAFLTPAGEIAGPVHTAYGYHVIKVVEKKIGKPFEFSEVEVHVKAALQQQLARNYIDTLKKSAKISVSQ